MENPKTGVTRKQSALDFPKNEHFLPPYTHITLDFPKNEPFLPPYTHISPEHIRKPLGF